MKGGEGPLERVTLSPSKPPSLPENFPHDPAIYKAEICFALYSGGVVGEVFVVLGGANLLQSAAIAHDWWDKGLTR